MQRIIVRMFRNGDLTPLSPIIDVPSIGPYLYARLKRSLSPRTRELTIRMFAHKIRRMNTDRLKTTLQRGLQNRRNNECVRSRPRRPLYHVPDFNLYGWKAIISLIKVLHRNQDGHQLGNGFVFDVNSLRMPHARSESAKTLPCVSRQRCGRQGGTYRDGLCQPPNAARGFPGVHLHSGQRARRGQGNIRGRYATSANRQTMWRRPGSLRKL